MTRDTGGNSGSRLPRPLAALSPQRRRFVYIIAGLVVAAVIAAVLPNVLHHTDQPAPTAFPAQDKPGAVLLVPGYGGSTQSLTTLADRLRATGRQVIVVQMPDSGTGSLEVQANVLNNDVESALRSEPSVDVIGYSAGGVVTRLWSEEFDGADKARRVVTFGSPYHGTTVAAGADALDPADCPVACQQLVPNSSLLTRIAGEPLNGHPQWLSLWTTQDQTVVPPTSADLPGALDVPLQSVCADEQVSHGDLPTDPLVIGIVLQALSSTTMTAPTAADCASLRALGK